MPESEQVERFTAVYREHHSHVYGYAVARAGRELADEVVADTFLVAWRRIAVLPMSSPLPWLLAVARNIVRERYRGEARQRAVAIEMRAWIGEEQLLAADVAEGVAERAAVLAALAQLSEQDRELLTLVAWHGLPPRETARVVGCSLATYFVRMHRARRRLENAMAAAAEPSMPQSARTPLVPRESIR